MYSFLIQEYETKPFPSYLFDLALTYHVKKGDFDTVKQIIEKTDWKTKENLHVVKVCSLFDCSIYKKPSYKLFKFLFSQLDYHDPIENFGFKISGEDIKKYDLCKVIDNCISSNKLKFLSMLLKDYSHLNVIEHTLVSCIKTNHNEIFKEYYELNKSPSLQEKSITNSISFKNIFLLEYLSKGNNIFNSYSSWNAERYPEQEKEHYYINSKRYLQVMSLNHKITNKIIIKHITSKDFCFCITELLNKNRNQLANLWLDKLKNNELPFQIKDIDVLGQIKVNFDILSLKSFCMYCNLAEEQRILEKPLLSDYRIINCLNKKILNAITHRKVGYLSFIKKQFKLEKTLFNSYLIDSYYSEMSPTSMKLEHELPPVSIEKKINLCLANKENTYLTRILKEHTWEDINKIFNDNKIDKFNAQHLLYHYMNNTLDSKTATKKIKI